MCLQLIQCVYVFDNTIYGVSVLLVCYLVSSPLNILINSLYFYLLFFSGCGHMWELEPYRVS